MAGLYHKVRTDGAAKGLRDDHVAINLVHISYTTLHTTAVAFGDTETAAIAKKSMIECAKFVAEVDAPVPPTVFRELQNGDFGSLDSTAPDAPRPLAELCSQGRSPVNSTGLPDRTDTFVAWCQAVLKDA